MRLLSFSKLVYEDLGWFCSWNMCHNRLFQYLVCGHCHIVPLIRQGVVWQCYSHALIEKRKGQVRNVDGNWKSSNCVFLSHSSFTPCSLHLALAASPGCCPFATHSGSQRIFLFTRHQAFHHLSLSGKFVCFLAIMEISSNPVSLFFQLEDYKWIYN